MPALAVAINSSEVEGLAPLKKSSVPQMAVAATATWKVEVWCWWCWPPECREKQIIQKAVISTPQQQSQQQQQQLQVWHVDENPSTKIYQKISTPSAPQTPLPNHANEISFEKLWPDPGGANPSAQPNGVPPLPVGGRGSMGKFFVFKHPPPPLSYDGFLQPATRGRS